MKGLSVSRGNMYPWVTHMWSPIVGCPHQCAYCYVRSRGRDQPAEVKLKDKWADVDLGEGRTIFVAHLSDLFAEGVSDSIISDVLMFCRLYENKYVFQTKNPCRMIRFLDRMPHDFMVGTTIETNRQEILDALSRAPAAWLRASCMREIQREKFLTIEPIMDFNLEALVELVFMVKPDFVNIGADSKGHNLPEPSGSKVIGLIAQLQNWGVAIREKNNLWRLTG